jgi:LmbE family N-acetylglucosaminyl deacetylase
LIKAAKPGKSIRVVLYSDNQESINSNNKKSAIETRSAEFREAMNILGINDFHELKLAPSNFRLTEETVELTTGEINEYLPDVILLPSFIDNHEEHKILNLILSKALQRISYKTDILMYEVWSAIYPNTIFDITDVMEQKQKALKSYASQLENIDYVGAISGLNRYRSLTIKGNGYCEGFAYLNSGDYLKLIRKFG